MPRELQRAMLGERRQLDIGVVAHGARTPLVCSEKFTNAAIAVMQTDETTFVMAANFIRNIAHVAIVDGFVLAHVLQQWSRRRCLLAFQLRVEPCRRRIEL